MYYTEENKHHIHIIDNFLNYRQLNQLIHLKEKKQELQYANSKLIENLDLFKYLSLNI